MQEKINVNNTYRAAKKIKYAVAFSANKNP